MEGGCLQEGGQRKEKGLLSKLRLNKKEFLHIITSGRCYRKGGMSIYLLKDRKGGIGISISKKIKGAVLKNKLKRRIREICWRNKEKFLDNSLVVIVYKPLSYKLLEALFLSLLKNV
ncbi:MAG: ribonuclease P protein component [bacterium]